MLCFDILACVGVGLEELTTNVENKSIIFIVLYFEMLARVSVSLVPYLPSLSSKLRLSKPTEAVPASQPIFLLYWADTKRYKTMRKVLNQEALPRFGKWPRQKVEKHLEQEITLKPSQAGYMKLGFKLPKELRRGKCHAQHGGRDDCNWRLPPGGSWNQQGWTNSSWGWRLKLQIMGERNG